MDDTDILRRIRDALDDVVDNVLDDDDVDVAPGRDEPGP